MANIVSCSSSAKRPTRKHYACFNADFRGYLHHCSVLTFSERRDGPSAVSKSCADPYVVGDKSAVNACTEVL